MHYPELRQDLTRAILAWTLVASFHPASSALVAYAASHPEYQSATYWLGAAHVVIYFLALAALVYRQVFMFRSTVRDMLINRVLLEGFWLTEWIRRRNALLIAAGIVVSAMMALSLMLYVFISSAYIVGLLLVDAALLVWVHRKVHMRFVGKVFQPDIAALVSEFTPVALNVVLLFAGFALVSIIDTGDVYPPGAVEIPEHVSATVFHTFKPFQMLARTVYFLDLNVRSLRSVPGSGWYLYMAVYLTTISTVPFTSYSLALKSAMHIMRDAQEPYEKETRNE